MLLNADLTRRVVLDTATLEWVTSPEPGVERRLLERDGDEVARATSLVRYAPGSRFGRHEHGGGEELLVLEGTLEDEQGRYEAGTWLHNPAGSAHAPFSTAGCVLWVKLGQADPAQRQRLVVDTRNGGWRGPAEGVQRLMFFGDHGAPQRAYVARFAPGARVPFHAHPGGEELFILEGELRDEHGRYPAGTWLRQPHGSEHGPFSETGARVLVRQGHMAH
jgi:anti-sigma factor ChrR (cupin superfamily)